MLHSIRTRFVLGLLLIAGLFAGAVLLAWTEISGAGGTIRDTYDGPLQAVDAGRSAERDFNDLRRHFLAASTMPERQWAERYKALHNRLDADLQRQIALAPNPNIRDAAESARRLLGKWDSMLLGGQFLQKARQIDALADQLQALLDQNVAASQSIAAEAVTRAIGAINEGGRNIAGAGAAALIIGLIVLLLLTRSIISPIERAVAAAARIAAGDYSDQLERGRLDEPGRLLTALATMQDAIQGAHLDLQRKNAELEEIASTDKLTGLCNRRRLEEQARLQVASVRRYGHALSVILLDIDHFKAVNDTYGHQAGDQVLMHIGGILRRTVREADIPGRWGGEEFLILLPNTELEAAVLVAEKIRSAIEVHPFPVVGKKTSSFGVAEIAEKEAFTSVVERADQALYQAKEAGRNQVTAAIPLPSPQSVRLVM